MNHCFVDIVIMKKWAGKEDLKIMDEINKYINYKTLNNVTFVTNVTK